MGPCLVLHIRWMQRCQVRHDVHERENSSNATTRRSTSFEGGQALITHRTCRVWQMALRQFVRRPSFSQDRWRGRVANMVCSWYTCLLSQRGNFMWNIDLMSCFMASACLSESGRRVYQVAMERQSRRNEGGTKG